MPDLVYRPPAPEETDAVLAFLSRGIAGAEAYTFLRLNREKLPAGCFWCAFEHGAVHSVVYNNGDRTVTVAPGADPYPGLVLMRFAGSVPLPDGRAVPLTNADVPEVYRAVSERESLSPDDENRCVDRMRAMRDGLAAGFGVKENGRLLSFAFITACNETSALLGDVYTRPAYRGWGYAAACVLACVAAANRDVYLICEEPLTGFYEKLGFASVGKNLE